jgi:hypothetical protein
LLRAFLHLQRPRSGKLQIAKKKSDRRIWKRKKSSTKKLKYWSSSCVPFFFEDGHVISNCKFFPTTIETAKYFCEVSPNHCTMSKLQNNEKHFRKMVVKRVFSMCHDNHDNLNTIFHKATNHCRSSSQHYIYILQQKENNLPPHFRALPKLNCTQNSQKMAGLEPQSIRQLFRKGDAFWNIKFPNIPKIWLRAKLNLTLVTASFLGHSLWKLLSVFPRTVVERGDTVTELHWLWPALWMPPNGKQDPCHVTHWTPCWL